MLEFVHFLVMAKGGYFLAVFLLQLQLSKENLPENCANPQRSISSPLNSYGNTMRVDLVCIGLRREP